MKVKANGPLYEGGQNYSKGDTLEVDEKRAKALGDAVTPVAEEKKETDAGEKTKSKK